MEYVSRNKILIALRHEDQINLCGKQDAGLGGIRSCRISQTLAIGF